MDYYKDRLTNVTTCLFDWIRGSGSSPAIVKSWTNRLNEIRSDCDKQPQVEIAIVGSTGAGKSTLLNALLGERILAVSDMKPCTAVTTTVRYRVAQMYRAEIVFFSDIEWEMEIEALRKMISEQGEEDNDNGAEFENLKKVDQDKLKAAYALDELTADIDFSSLSLPDDLKQYMDPDAKPLILEEADVREFQKKLKKYLSGDDRFWPLVKSVFIEGPFERLKNGAVLVDLPGVNDPNEARVEVTRKHLQSAPFIWVVFNMKRALTKDIRDLLIEQKLLRQLLIEGKVNALTLIGTHADEYSEDGLEELGLTEDSEPVEIIRERNTRVVKQLQKDLQDLAKELANGAMKIDESYRKLKSSLRETRIFTVSTPAYMKLEGIGKLKKDFGINDPRDTGIPQLLEHLEALVKNHGAEAYYRQVGQKLILLLEDIKQFLNNQKKAATSERTQIDAHLEELRRLLRRPQQELEKELNQNLAKYAESYSIRQSDFEERLNEAVLRGRNGLNTKLESWRTIHWATLKATVVRHGRFTSPSTHMRYDLSGDIADSLMETMPFVWDDFFGNFCENKLAQVKGELDGSARVFFAQMQAEAKATKLFEDSVLEEINASVAVSRQHIDFHTNQIIDGLKNTVRRVRTELASAVNETIQQLMNPAYETSSEESGKGMKQRILEILQTRARQSEELMFTTIETDLRYGINELGLQFNDRLRELNQKVLELADRILTNMKIETIEVGRQLSVEEQIKQLHESDKKMNEHISNLSNE